MRRLAETDTSFSGWLVVGKARKYFVVQNEGLYQVEGEALNYIPVTRVTVGDERSMILHLSDGEMLELRAETRDSHVAWVTVISKICKKRVFG